ADLSGTYGDAEHSTLRGFIAGFIATPGTDDVIIQGDINLNGGDLQVVADHFTLKANADIQSTGGDVTIWARDIGTKLENLSPVFVIEREASVTIENGASISAHDVQLWSYTWDGASFASLVDIDS